MGDCLITRRGGETYRLPILNSNYPQDVNISVIKGNTTSATFNVIIAKQGNPAVYTYQWYVNGDAVSGATSSTYTKSGLSDTATYSIFCEITNKKGTVTSRVATLNVTQIYKPVLDNSYPKDVTTTVIKGNTISATFSVNISEQGYPDTYTYQWYRNDTVVSGATGSTYTISGISDTVNYSIYCVVGNKAGNVTSRTATMSITQLYTPVLNSSYPANQTVEIDQSVTSKVSISTAGNPASYTYQWYKNGSKVSGATSSSYTFTPTVIGSTTLYCEVTNSAGVVKSRTATISCTKYYIVKDGTIKVSKSYSGMTASTSSGILTLQQATSVSGEVCYANFGPVDLTNYKTLKAIVTAQNLNNTEYSNKFGVAKSTNSTSYAASVKPTATTLSVNVSSLSGSYYIGFAIYKTHVSGSYRYVKTSNVWLE